MTANGQPPTLTDRRGLGGIIAQDGFDYQLWDGLVRLPAWLANPVFDHLLFEGLEDLEARFFSPYAPHQYVLDRYQAKSAVLSRPETVEVFRAFLAFEQAYPQHARLYTLVTPQLVPALKWLSRDPSRVRKARPFYAPFPAIVCASDEKLRQDLDKELGQPLAAFVADTVEIAERPLPDRDTAVQAFSLSLSRSFPGLDIGASAAERAFEDLSALARRSIGVPLHRAVLTQALETSLSKSISRASFPLFVRSDRNESDERSLEIDARAFSGGPGGYPASETWTKTLVAPLNKTATWLRTQGVSRIAINGSYRLTTAFALGWSFRSAIGFELEIPTRDGPWMTDDRPTPDSEVPAWTIRQPKALFNGRLPISIGVIRDPSTELRGTVPEDASLSCLIGGPITSAKMAQQSVSVLKRAVDAAVGALKPDGIDLYCVGPAALMAALGHRWNAMPATQLYEFRVNDRTYVRTAKVA